MQAQGLKVREQKTVNVKGDSYTLTKFSAIKGLKFQKYLLKVFGDAWIEYQSAETPTLAGILSKVIDNIDDIDENVLMEMVCLSLDMLPSDFDYKFSGKTSTVYLLLREIVSFNYDDLFTMLGMAVTGLGQQDQAGEDQTEEQ